MLAGILITVQILVAIIMGGLILLQRSEGGALGMGGGPSGLVSARGAGNILTKTTSILAIIFFVNSMLLTIVFSKDKSSQSAINKVDTSKIEQTVLPAQTTNDAPITQSEPTKPSLSDLPLASLPLASNLTSSSASVSPGTAQAPTVSVSNSASSPKPKS